jgi:radical SAM protein with 4Fe4S-binding SPASM domain
MEAAGALVPGFEVVQLFRSTAPDLRLVAPLMASYASVRTSRVALSLYRLPDGPEPFNPASLRASPPYTMRREDGAALGDHTPFELRLDAGTIAPGELLALRLHSEDATYETCLTAWLDDGDRRIAGHEACFAGGRRLDGLGLVAELRYAPTIPSLPRFLLYSPVTQCNLNCIHCISRETRAHAVRLPDSVREQIRAWSRDGRLKAVVTDYSGDILWADARFGGELDFLFSLDLPLHIDTNGAYLTAGTAKRLMGSRLQSINISLDAADEETYRRIRKGAPPLAEVGARIAELAVIRRDAGRADIRLSMSFTVMRSTLDQLPAFIRLAARLGVPLVIARHLEAYTADLGSESLWDDKARFNAMRAEALAVADAEGVELGIDAPLEERPHRTGHRGFCDIPWKSAVVLGNGDVAVCCVPRTKIGNLGEQTMEEIWNGPLYQAFRSAVNSTHPPPMCAACPMFRRANNADSYMPFRVMDGWVSPYDVARGVSRGAR